MCARTSAHQLRNRVCAWIVLVVSEAEYDRGLVETGERSKIAERTVSARRIEGGRSSEIFELAESQVGGNIEPS